MGQNDALDMQSCKRKMVRHWWVLHREERGIWEFSFDKRTIYNMFEDYPEKLSVEERQIFDNENPYWAKFFRGENEDKIVDSEN